MSRTDDVVTRAAGAGRIAVMTVALLGSAPALAQQVPGAVPGTAGQHEVIYSPWTKMCAPPAQAQGKLICMTVKEARFETAQFVAGLALIEEGGVAKKLLRVTIPLGMQIEYGTRLIVDNGQALTSPYATCVQNGCMADFEVDENFIAQMKKGQQVLLQGINTSGHASSYALPLNDFASANDGQPVDPKTFEEQQKKFWEERLKNRAAQQGQK